MDDISQQLALRDSYRRKLALRTTPAERLQTMARLQQRSWDLLRASPAGYAHFLVRNYKARSIRVAPESHVS
jgi:hypothetical protein